MGPRAIPDSVTAAVDAVRAKLLLSLHLGQHDPGDRAPSIRRMAALTTLNPKTVQRAYRQLSEEGLLDVRWGSGTFFSDGKRRWTHAPLPGSLLEAAQRFRVEADHLGVGSDTFLRFLELFMGQGLRATPIAVAECNREQIGLIERELSMALGVATHEVLITELVAHHPTLLSSVRGVVTTDCHRQEVTEMVAPFNIPVYRVALAPEFTQKLIRHAKRRPVLMVVRDRRYGPVLHRMLQQMQVPREVAERIRIVSATEFASRTTALREGGAVYISPLVARQLGGMRLPDGVHRIRLGRYLATTAVDALKAQLALELATR